MITVRLSTLTAAVLLALLVVTTASATADDGREADPARAADLEHVFDQLEEGTPYDALSPEDRAVLDAHVLVAEEVVEFVEVRPAPLAAAATEDEGASTTSVSFCAIGRVVYSAIALAGNTLYTYFVEGTWCGDELTVESAQHEWSGGEASGPGWTYHGVQDFGGGVAANEGRAWSQHRFTLDFVGVTLQDDRPCVRMRGTAAGALNHDEVCGLN